MPSAATYAGIASGLANVANYERERPMREARTAEAKAKQEKAELSLQDYKQQTPNRQSRAELELEQLRGQVFEERATSMRNQSFATFSAYDGDNDTRHLNNLLVDARKNPAGKMWDKWARFDPMIRNTKTEAMLGRMGIPAEAMDGYFNDPNLTSTKVLGTDRFGEQSLVDLNKLYQATGYTKHMKTQELQNAMLQAKIDNMLMGEQSADTASIARIAEEDGLTYSEATKKYYDMKNSQRRTGTAAERQADHLQTENPTMSRDEALRTSVRQLASPSGAEKNIELTAGIREQLHGLNTEGDFYDLDLKNPATRARAGELIVDLEQATGKKLTGETKKSARKIRSLLELGATAGSELSDEETGILDSMLYNLKKYVSDSVEGTAGTSTYNAMRNIQRNALMGATLTPAELKAFDKAAGTLGYQLGPVLGHLRTSLEDAKNQLQTIVDFEDPMAAKYYLGTSIDDAQKSIDAIDDRLRAISGYESRAQSGNEIKVSDVKKTQPQVQVNIPSKITPDGSKPNKSARERMNELMGTN